MKSLTFNHEGRPVWLDLDTGGVEWCIDPNIATPSQIQQAYSDPRPNYDWYYSGNAFRPYSSGAPYFTSGLNTTFNNGDPVI